MKNLFLLTVSVVAASALPSDLPRLVNKLYQTGRIVGGEETSISEVPHQVSIQVRGLFDCGGSIIASEWILTAGHCAMNPIELYTVRTGSDASQYGGHVYEVAEKYLHERFFINRWGVPRNDIALFRLKKPIELDDTQKPVKLFNKDEETKVGAYAVVTGYGRTETGRISVTLRRVIVPVIGKNDCFNAYRTRFGGIEEHQICAAYPEGGKDACGGDSGGPMTIDGRLAGIVSWGDGCAVKGNPGVYTEVSKYRDWIAEKTGLNL